MCVHGVRLLLMDLCQIFKPILILLNRCRKEDYRDNIPHKDTIPYTDNIPYMDRIPYMDSIPYIDRVSSKILPEELEKSEMARTLGHILILTIYVLVGYMICKVIEKICVAIVCFLCPPTAIQREPVRMRYSDEDKGHVSGKGQSIETPEENELSISESKRMSLPVETPLDQKLNIRNHSNTPTRPATDDTCDTPFTITTSTQGEVNLSPNTTGGQEGTDKEVESETSSYAKKGVKDGLREQVKVGTVHKLEPASPAFYLGENNSEPQTENNSSTSGDGKIKRVDSLNLLDRFSDTSSSATTLPARYCSKCDNLTFHQHTFKWSQGGNKVYLTGSFLNWCTEFPMQPNIQDGTHELTITLPRGHHEFKFHVDGQWRLDPQLTTHTNTQGNTNHVIHLR